MVATSPLLRKGGVHEQSNRAKRLAANNAPPPPAGGEVGGGTLNQLRRDLKATAAQDKSP